MSSFCSVTADQIQQIVGETAPRYGLPSGVVAAVVQVESGGNIWAWNPEPKYRWFWDVRTNQPFRPVTPEELASKIPPKDFKSCRPDIDRDVEWWGQQASWGLMQLMGAVARERGFTEDFLNSLHDPAANIDVGCRHLAGYVKRYLPSYGWAGVFRAYNGGPYAAVHNSNPEYPEKIRSALGGSFPNA